VRSRPGRNRLGCRYPGAEWVEERGHTGIWQLYASRPLIESTVRELCQGRDNVTVLARTEVTALRVSREAPRYCTGVEVLLRDDGKTHTLDADLVVDASGEARQFVWATDESQLEFVRRYISTAPDRPIITEEQKQESLAAARGDLVVQK
jgi:2-polyprenyl-6-methoxyphenol hydroxylase-like FAD-dependent oxidoreductase